MAIPTPPKPPVTDALITFLEHNFRDECPALDTTQREIWMAAGAVKVVKCLKAIRDNQARATLKGQT